MEEYLCQYSCQFCIWNEYCEDEQPCDFYDDGQDKINLSDLEIEKHIEDERTKYRNEYKEYLKEFYLG